MERSERGLLHRASYDQQIAIEQQLTPVFVDVYDTIDDLQEVTKELERLVVTILYGSSYEDPSMSRRM